MLAALLPCPAAARADWSGDGPADVLAIHPDGRLLLYRGNGAGGWIAGAGETIAQGWGGSDALLAPGDFSGDGKPDLLLRAHDDGRLMMYRGNGAGGFSGTGQQVGTGWGPFTALVAPGDFSGDGLPDLLARQQDGTLLMYRGDGDGGWVTGAGEPIGSGWQGFTAIIPGGDFSGDGHPDLLAVHPDGTLYLYRGNGAGGWVVGRGEPVGCCGWAAFTAILGGGDFDGDTKPDVLARQQDGTLLLYRGNGAGGWLATTGQPIGSGWESLAPLALVPTTPPAPPAPAPQPAPAPVPLPDGSVTLHAGVRCTPPGGRLRVALSIRKRAGRPAPRVSRILFYVRKGPHRTDRHKPYVVRLRLNRPAGAKGRVYARVYYRRTGSKTLHRKTVSRRFVMCG